jgi:glycerate-2-kinase
LEDVLGDSITDGVVLDVRGGKLRRIKSLVGTHPDPTQTNVSATREIISLLQSADEEDLILAVVSGGGSALLCSPYQLSCEVKASISTALMNAGANIEEVNIVRKHLSEIKGGNFAKFAYPARVMSLIFSDVPGNDIGVIASGPTVLDTTTVADASRIMAKYKVLKLCRLPHCDLVETPKEPRYFQLVTNVVVADSRLAIDAMRVQAVKLEYKPEVLSTRLEGGAEDVARRLVLSSKPNTALIAAGETTVEVKGKGTGGRNQHTVLAALENVGEDKVVISINSDGVDHSRYAGAIGDRNTIEKAKKKRTPLKKFLNTFDSFHFFQKVRDGIETGPLGENVSDFMLVLSR